MTIRILRDLNIYKISYNINIYINIYIYGSVIAKPTNKNKNLRKYDNRNNNKICYIYIEYSQNVVNIRKKKHNKNVTRFHEARNL